MADSDFEIKDGVLVKYNGNDEYIAIPYGVKKIGISAFEDCESLTETDIPDSVTEIEKDAFWGCTLLIEIYIPNSVTKIGDTAFWYCSSLEEINIPDSVMEIGKNAFECCYSLKKIDVSINNEYYSSENGVLFNKNKTLLIKYPSDIENKIYSIPNSVKIIAENAFEHCLSLNEIYAPKGLDLSKTHYPENCKIIRY